MEKALVEIALPIAAAGNGPNTGKTDLTAVFHELKTWVAGSKERLEALQIVNQEMKGRRSSAILHQANQVLELLKPPAPPVRPPPPPLRKKITRR